MINSDVDDVFHPQKKVGTVADPTIQCIAYLWEWLPATKKGLKSPFAAGSRTNLRFSAWPYTL
jgi:hypothetical protein